MIRTLHPAYFALVMATGIVSIAAQLLGIPFVPRILLGVNVGAFVVLWVLTLMRIVHFPREVMADAGDHQRGVGFFTAVAATSVLGSQLVIVAQGIERLTTHKDEELKILVRCVKVMTDARRRDRCVRRRGLSLVSRRAPRARIGVSRTNR